MTMETLGVLQNEEILSELAANCPDMVLPAGYCYQRTAAAIVQSHDPSKMSATFAIVTRTAQPNRYGNQLQLLPNANGAGPVTDYYDANPVVLYDHGLSGLTLPIGLSKPKDGPLSLAWSADKGIATCYFADQPWAEPIFAAVDDGLLKMSSIGFDPILAMRIKPAGPQQAAAADGVMDCTYLGMDFTQWELLEWSIVPIGADRGALRQCLDRGHIHGVKLNAALKQSFSKHAAEVRKLGIGADFKQAKWDAVTLEGATSEVDALLQTLQKTKAAPSCPDCGGVMQCLQCLKQSDDDDPDNDIDITEDPPEPDIAPDWGMSYSAEVAQACASQLNQSQMKAVQQSVLQGVNQAVEAAIAPVAKSVASVANEFKRMRGKVE